jgi:hypothetical protein
MNKVLCLFSCVFAFVSAVYAGEEAAVAPPAAETAAFSFNFITEPSQALIVDGARINIFYGRAQEVKGLSIGSVNITDATLKGAEFGFVNSAGSLEGYMSGFVNTTGKTTGVRRVS